MANEPNYLTYSYQLNKIIDSFGYNWWYDRDYAVLDTQVKNNELFQTMADLERHLPLLKNLDHSAANKINKILDRFFTRAKIPSFADLLADVVLIILFLFILWEFVFKIFNWIGIICPVAAILYLFYLLISSFHAVLLSDEQYLNVMFGFERHGALLKTKVLNIVRKKERELISNVFFASLFILLAILRFIYNYPALVFVTSYFNFVAFLFVIPIFIIQYKLNKLIAKDVKAARQKLIAAYISITFFIVYVISIADNYQEVKQVIGYLVDLMVFYGVMLFIRDLIGAIKYRTWTNEKSREGINNSKK